MHIYKKSVEIACVSMGEVYGKIENYGCVWNPTGGHQNGPFSVGVAKAEGDH